MPRRHQLPNQRTLDIDCVQRCTPSHAPWFRLSDSPAAIALVTHHACWRHLMPIFFFFRCHCCQSKGGGRKGRLKKQRALRGYTLRYFRGFPPLPPEARRRKYTEERFKTRLPFLDPNIPLYHGCLPLLLRIPINGPR